MDDVPWVDDWLGAAGIRLKVLHTDVEGAVFVGSRCRASSTAAAAATPTGSDTRDRDLRV